MALDSWLWGLFNGPGMTMGPVAPGSKSPIDLTGVIPGGLPDPTADVGPTFGTSSVATPDSMKTDSWARYQRALAAGAQATTPPRTPQTPMGEFFGHRRVR